MARHRGGRKKQIGDRYASGDLKPQKLGPTPERAAQRAILTRGADPALAESPLGILVAHGLIDSDTWRAADRYAVAKRIRFGSGQPKGLNLVGAGVGGAAFNPKLDSGGTEKGEMWAKAVLAEAEEIFAGRPRRHRDLFDNAVVYKRFPAWIGEPVLSPAHRPELAVLLELLAEMAVRLGVKPRKQERAA